ncbi:MAG: VWA domain-containing protein [Ardenticatenia bacterium]|nr:VWA domain-containing protein [Ardenticatenia bacterium]
MIPLRKLLSIVLLIAVSACRSAPLDKASSPDPSTASAGDFVIVAGSENRALEPILTAYGKDQGRNIKVEYQGSVDIKLALQQGPGFKANAVWPANSLWISLGDVQRVVKHAQPVFWSPLVLGTTVADDLAWTGGRAVSMEDVRQASAAGKLRFLMTNATQSNSGAMTYLAALSACAGSPEILLEAQLRDPAISSCIKAWLSEVDRSSGSSGWAMDLYVEHPYLFNGMFNYESLVIEANQKLVAEGREPLVAVYPEDGTAIADSPLGYVDHGNAADEAFFLKLQEHLLSDSIQRQIQSTGRRIGSPSQAMSGADTVTVFRSDWGIDLTRTIVPIRYPARDVIEEALHLYQTTFRRPSLTVFCLDYSGSMSGDPERELKSAMALLLDQGEAARYMLETAPNDITAIVLFNEGIVAEVRVEGNDPGGLTDALNLVRDTQAGGGTDIYRPVMRAIDILKALPYENYSAAVILMSDGKNESATSLDDVKRHLTAAGNPGIPVHSIAFGAASEAELAAISQLTAGRAFGKTDDLVTAFRNAKGYN